MQLSKLISLSTQTLFIILLVSTIANSSLIVKSVIYINCVVLSLLSTDYCQVVISKISLTDFHIHTFQYKHTIIILYIIDTL